MFPVNFPINQYLDQIQPIPGSRKGWQSVVAGGGRGSPTEMADGVPKWIDRIQHGFPVSSFICM